MSYAQISVDIDEADAVVLQENLSKTRDLISQISTSLNRISNRTLNSSHLLNPIVEKNRSLNILKKNIDDSIFQVSNIQGIASEASLYESKLSRNIDNVKQYITTIHKSDDILEKLNDSKDGIEYKGIQENLSRTLGESVKKLQQFLFDDLLKSASTSFDPQVFINDSKPYPYIDDSKLKDSVAIIQFFQHTDYDKPIAIEARYIDNRIKLVSTSLAFIEPFVKTKKDNKIPFEKGTNGINNYTEALIGFIYNEYALLEDLFKESSVEIDLFKKIFKPILEKYQTLSVTVLNSYQYSASLTSLTPPSSSSSITNGLIVFELIDNITQVQQAMINKTSEPSAELKKALNSCQATTKSLLQAVFRYTEDKVFKHAPIPSDSGVSEATIEIMSILRKFSEFKDSLTKLMSNGQWKAGSWLPSPKPQSITVFSSISIQTLADDEHGAQLLSYFFSDVLDCLIISLEIKANQSHIKKKQTLGFFLITNISLIEQIISRSELNSILQGTGIARLDKLKKRAINFFLTGWKNAAAYLLDVNITGKMTSKDKDAIKDKFRNFNSEFDELIKSYKQFNITDPGLKKFLSKEIGFISPLYHRFYDKHSQGDFTKHTDRYIKYTKVEFDKILESLSK